ncbi:MAG: hypothetical protein PF904_00240 [Kiritimatiellae bacterium]|jgi:hypothetical protein|nr:hypothetical protein [Kiritimatiellia bacterium]
MSLRFKRYIKHQTKEITPRRMSIAQRSVDKDKDQYALFPELVRFNTPIERIKAQDHRAKSATQYRRDQRAKAWHKARQIIRSLSPLQRAGVLQYWNHGTQCPADPASLLDFLCRFQSGRDSGWSNLRRLRQIRLVGSGILPRCTVFSEPMHNPCNINANL